MNDLKCFSFLIIFSLSFGISNAQQDDFCSWNYLNIRLKLNPEWSVGFNEHYLRKENVSERWMNIHDLYTTHSIKSWLTQEFHLRSMQVQKLNDHIENRWLFYYALEGKFKWHGIQFNLRTRWQQLTFEDHWNDQFKGPYYYHRFKVSIQYPFNYHIKPSISCEIFNPLNRPDHLKIDQLRSSINLIYRFNQNLSMDTFYQLQQPLGRSLPKRYFILGIGFNLTL